MADRKSRAPRGDWKNLGNPPRDAPLNKNPYAGLNIQSYNSGIKPVAEGASSNNNKQNADESIISSAPMDHDSSSQFLSVDNIDKARVHRRFSVRLNGPPALDFSHHPLPLNSQGMIKNEQSYSSQQAQDGQDVATLRQRARSNSAANKYVSIGNVYDTELSFLANRDFDASAYIKENLSNATAMKIDEFSKNMSKLSVQVDDQIKDVINKSLKNLSKTSKDFNETELEIKSLKTIFNELNEIIQNMKENADMRLTLEKSNNGNKRDRSSILVVQKLWDKELQSLFNHVAGAQQLISAVPGRHVLAESGKWNEVSATTMKPLQTVHLFVLNDHFLVASKRRQNDDNNSGNKYNKSQNLIANQCWSLREIKLFDLKVQGQFHMIKIVHQSSKYVYRTERFDHYNKVLDAYRRGKDELRTVVENDNLKQSGSISRTASQLRRKSNNKERRSSGILNKGHQRTRSLEIFTNDTIISLKSLDDNIDELDIQISRKHLGEAVILLKAIEKEVTQLSQKKMDSAIEEISQIIENLKLRLASRRKLIIEELTRNFYPSNQKSLSPREAEKLVDLFSQLDIIEVGRDNFLQSRTLMINNLIDKVEINGIIPDFITQISIIRFQIIKTTIDIYQHCFQHESQSYFLINWCFNQIKQHANFLSQQLNGVDSNSVNYRDCVDVTKKQVEGLRGVGVDVGFLLDSFYKSVDAR